MADLSDTAGLTFFEISKSFGGFDAVKDFSMRVARGEVVALFGPNGAGKTTLLRVAAGVSRPSSGRVLIEGLDLARVPREAKRAVGWLAEESFGYGELTAKENLEFFGRLYGLEPAQASQAAQRAIDEIGLAHRAADALETLSHGMQKRLSFARALLHNPSVLLLDEPFEGIDPRGQQALADRLRDETSRKARATLLVTHHLELGLAVCDRAAVIDRGRLVKVVARGELDGAAFARELSALGGEPPAR